jgi:hypothetical protein
MTAEGFNLLAFHHSLAVKREFPLPSLHDTMPAGDTTVQGYNSLGFDDVGQWFSVHAAAVYNKFCVFGDKACNYFVCRTLTIIMDVLFICKADNHQLTSLNRFAAFLKLVPELRIEPRCPCERGILRRN